MNFRLRRHSHHNKQEKTSDLDRFIEIYRTFYINMLDRDINDIEKQAIRKRYENSDFSVFSAGDLIKEIIRSDEFFNKHREDLFLKVFPKSLVVAAAGPLGDELLVDLRQLHLGFAMAAGHYEPDEVAFVKAFIKPGFRILDIGANIGFFTNMFARLTGFSGTVFAFEPVGDTYRKLVASIHRNGWEAVVQTFQLALADTAGHMDISYAEASLNMGGAHLAEIGEASVGEIRERVRVARLDECVPVTRYDFVKMDVEGAEWLVIQGAGPIFQKFTPPLMIEFNRTQLRNLSKIEPEALLQTLLDYGYDANMIAPGGSLRHLASPIEDLSRKFDEQDVVNLILMRN